MSEKVLLRTTGGPTGGETRVVDTSLMPWPLPDTLPHPLGGAYRKVSESQLPPQTDSSHVMRGAEYVWVEATGDQGH